MPYYRDGGQKLKPVEKVDRRADMSIPIVVQLMSGELLPMEFERKTSIHGLQRKLMDYCYDWKPMLLRLYHKDDEGNYLPCRPYVFVPTEGECLYLVVRKPILHEQLYFIHRYETYELWRLTCTLPPTYTTRWNITFAVKDGGKAFSLDAPYWDQVKFPNKGTWCSSLQEMLESDSETVASLPDEVRDNLVTLWETR